MTFLGVAFLGVALAARAKVIVRDDSYLLCMILALLIWYLSRPTLARAFGAHQQGRPDQRVPDT